MPDRRRHRGPHPEDARLFDPAAVETLRGAASDLVWLLDRGYAFGAATKLVGDRFQLAARQRAALQRSVCSTPALERRRAAHRPIASLAGDRLRIDGFNVLATVEAAIGGAVVLQGRDGAYRDLLGIHGSYRRIEETIPAMTLVGTTLDRAGVGPCVWYFDRPVSNSGRVGALLLEVAQSHGWTWSVELENNPDAELRRPGPCVATADGAILDDASRWTSLAREVVEASLPSAWVVSLFPKAPLLA